MIVKSHLISDGFLDFITEEHRSLHFLIPQHILIKGTMEHPSEIRQFQIERDEKKTIKR